MPKTDIFQWANNIDAMKRDLQPELFLINKNYTPYSLRYGSELAHTLSPVFMFDLINQVAMGAGVGMQVKELEAYEHNSNQLAWTGLEKVGRAETVIHLIEKERNDILEFSQEEHEFKRMVAIVARYTHPVDKDVVFYVFKLLQPASSISSGVRWQINNGQLEDMQPDVALKVPTDNQVLVIGGEIFIFNEPKFAKMFKYDIQEVIATDERAKILSDNYKLTLPNLFDDLGMFVRESRSSIKKILDVDTSNLISQDDVLEIADSMQIELMVDDAGAIILFDTKDLGVFLDIINDNYLEGHNGAYLVKSKKLHVTAEE